MKFTFRFLLFLLILYEFYASPITQINEFKSLVKRDADSKEEKKSEEADLKKEDNDDNDDKHDSKENHDKSDKDKSGEEEPSTTADASGESGESTTEPEVGNSNETEVEDKKSKESDEKEDKCKDKDSDEDSDECKKDKESIESEDASIDYKICGTEEVDCKKLLIILVDGLRHDYIDRDDEHLPAFEQIAARGVHIEQVRPVFPSNSIPNQYSIATGLYPEKHGIVNDYMYDESKKEVFTPEDYSEELWWLDSEPIWITARARKAAVSWWTGCELDIHGLPFKCSPYDDFNEDKHHDDLVESRLKEIVADFKVNNYSLAMLHYEHIDYTGQKYGPDSRQTHKAVRKLDEMLGNLIEEIEKQDMDDQMNVIILSDHGMSEKAAIIDLEKLEHFDENDFEMIVGNGAFVMLLPEKHRETHAYEALRNANVDGLNVYSKEKLKKRFRLRKNSHLLPIILTTDKGYLIQTPDAKGKAFPIEDLDELHGFHGFDPQDEEDMNTLMYGFGPDFKKNYTLEFAKQVDFFNLFCHLLDIERKPNDGSWSRIEKLLASDSDEESEENTTEASNEDDSEVLANTKKDSDDSSANSISVGLICVALITTNFICLFNQFKYSYIV